MFSGNLNTLPTSRTLSEFTQHFKGPAVNISPY